MNRFEISVTIINKIETSSPRQLQTKWSPFLNEICRYKNDKNVAQFIRREFFRQESLRL